MILDPILNSLGRECRVKKKAIAAFWIISYLAIVHCVVADTLEESLQHTVNSNPDILSTTKNRSAVEQELKQAKGGYLPSVDLNLGIGWERSQNPTTRARGERNVDMHREEAGVQLRQMVFDGFATSSEVKRQTARVDSSAYTVFGTAERIGLDVTEAYLNVLRREKLVELAKDNLVIHESTHDQILLRSKRGVARKADDAQSEARLALARTNLISENGNLRDARTNYMRAVGLIPGSLEVPADPWKYLPQSLEEAIQIGTDTNPVLQSAKFDVEAAKSQHDAAKSPYMPRFDVELGASHDYNLDGIRGSNEDVIAMLRVRYNLFNGGRDRARRGETAYLINQAKEIRNQTRRQVEESIRLSWVAYQTTLQQLDYFEAYKRSSERTYNAYVKQFDIGQRTLLDLLDTANELFEAKRNYVDAVYDRYFSAYRVLSSMGKLNESLKIQLPQEATALSEENR